MLVTRSQFKEVVAALSKPDLYGLDTETSGLGYTDRLFAVIIHDETQGYYFNFLEGSATNPDLVLPREWIKQLQVIFNEPRSLFFIHNAKFDTKMLLKEGVTLGENKHCTQITALLLNNLHFDYSLDACAARIGEKKDDTVEKYIIEKKLYVVEDVPGKKLKKKRKFFNKVPLDLMEKYAIQDAYLHRKLGLNQLDEMAALTDGKNLNDVYHNEHALIDVCIAMENTGVKISREYAEAGWNYETEYAQKLQHEFKETTGQDFVDSRVTFKKVFDELGITAPQTSKGNASFSAGALETFDTPIAKMIVDIRRHLKFAGTYYASFLHLADSNDIIRPNFRQDGAGTGRFSCTDPNLQNIPIRDEDGAVFHVRKCFIPRDDRFFLFADYKAQEALMMLDYAGEKNLIDEILAGKDIHQATADLMHVSRREAKTINFMLLYGGGVAKLAKSLECTIPEAQTLRNLYFARLPKVELFMDHVQRVARARGYVRTWLGRRLKLFNRDTAYKMINAIIQGGCADVIKVAMVRIAKLLEPYKTKMLLTIHDELAFEMPWDEIFLCGPIEQIMTEVYQPFNGLKLSCSLSHSFDSMGHPDRIAGIPNEKTRNEIQRKISSTTSQDSKIMVF